jgi:Ala-tRNA(Pro) deacylase
MKLDEMLANRHVSFERIHHRPVYTANRIAQELHVPGKEVAKTVLLRTDRGYVLAVVPATHRIDLEEVRKKLDLEDIEMAGEGEMSRVFPDCEVGAIPPFGSIYNLPTLVDESLAEDDRIVFESQNHEDAIRMSYKDYEQIEHPVRARFAHHA